MTESATRLYHIWESLKQRIRRTKVFMFKPWYNFKEFKLWAISQEYNDTLYLNRISKIGGYTPDNCEWETKSIVYRAAKRDPGKYSKYVGVSFNKTNWIAYIGINTIQKNLGRYPNDKLAAIARDTYILDNDLKNYRLNGVV